MKSVFRAVFPAILAVMLVSAGCMAPVPTPQPSETAAMEAVADTIATSVNAGLCEMKAGLANTTGIISKYGLSGKEASEAQSELILKYPWALSSFAISRDGIVMNAVPENYAGNIGENLSWQAIVRNANEKQAPTISPVFPLVEGFNGISQGYPVFSPSGEYLGYVDVTYDPATFLARHIEPVTNGTEYDVWVVQKDGTEIYDTTKEEIGKNIITDPIYADPVLQELAHRIVDEPAGNGTYTFWDKDWNRNVTKILTWDTVGIDGAEWRIAVTKVQDGSGQLPAVSATATALTTDARYANLTQFVENAKAYATANGKETALKEFNNASGSFIDGDLYIFAYEMNGTVIALPFQQGLLGTNRTGITDVNGVKFIDRLSGIAADGGGYLYYIYPNPDDNFREEFKISYVLPVDGTWFVGSGIYLPEVPAKFNMTERDALTDRVKQARQFAQEEGTAKSLAEFNNRSSIFADGSRYIFAYAFNGTCLALPFQPDLVGTNRMNLTDTWGVKVSAWESAVAREGGGYVYVHYLNPETNAADLKLCYVLPVDDTWFVGSGIYTDGM